MGWWQARGVDVLQWTRRMRSLDDDRFFESGFVANLMGVLYDSALIQIFAMMGMGADVMSVVRGRWDDPWFLLIGPVLLALLVTRIIRGGYRMTLTRIGRLAVNTASVPYFVADCLWLSFAVIWLLHSITSPPGTEFGPDADFYIGIPLTILVVTTLLTGLRLRT
jgi:hypothetical protein